MVAGIRLVRNHGLSHLSLETIAGERDACIVVRVNRLAEVYRVLEFLPQHIAT